VIYQYALDISPEIPADSATMLYKMVSNVRKQLKSQVGMVTSKGLMLWGTKQIAVATSIIS
jgi:hypothetical protein